MNSEIVAVYVVLDSVPVVAGALTAIQEMRAA